MAEAGEALTRALAGDVTSAAGTGTEATGTAPAAAAEPATTAAAPTINWDAEDNPYKKLADERDKAFKGLQGRVQQLTEAERQRAQAEWDATVASLTPEQATLANAAKEILAARGAVAEQAKQVFAQKQALEPDYRTRAFQVVNERSGIPVDLLQECQSPAEMEAAERVWVQAQERLKTIERDTAQRTRAETGADDFGRGGGQPLSKKPETFAEAHDELWKRLAALGG
jgi:hypothetical protein